MGKLDDLRLTDEIALLSEYNEETPEPIWPFGHCDKRALESSNQRQAPSDPDCPIES
jgi:hypothetical protein